jgi:hypothetical protein
VGHLRYTPRIRAPVWYGAAISGPFAGQSVPCGVQHPMVYRGTHAIPAMTPEGKDLPLSGIFHPRRPSGAFRKRESEASRRNWRWPPPVSAEHAALRQTLHEATSETTTAGAISLFDASSLPYSMVIIYRLW